MRLAWLSDTHLNFLVKREREAFYLSLTDSKIDRIIISGDIAEADSVCKYLTEMVEATNKPVYFVLGNHDYYRSSIQKVKNDIAKLTSKNPYLYWLEDSEVIELNKETALIGIDGWADSRLGSIHTTPVRVNDSNYIEELKIAKEKDNLEQMMQTLADNDASKLELKLQNAIDKSYKTIYVVTHIPPFYETINTENENEKLHNPNWFPYYVSKISGDICTRIARTHPDITLKVLSGHAHSGGSAQPLANLSMQTAKTEYGKPDIKQIIDIR